MYQATTRLLALSPFPPALSVRCWCSPPVGDGRTLWRLECPAHLVPTEGLSCKPPELRGRTLFAEDVAQTGSHTESVTLGSSFWRRSPGRKTEEVNTSTCIILRLKNHGGASEVRLGLHIVPIRCQNKTNLLTERWIAGSKREPRLIERDGYQLPVTKYSFPKYIIGR